MPKATTITRNIIIDTAFELVRTEGFQAFSARTIAKNIGCSTQPIYWTYKNMDDLKQDIILKMKEYLTLKMSTYRKTNKPFLDIGLGYIHTAHTEPILFKATYVENIMDIKLTDLIPAAIVTKAITADNRTANIPPEKRNSIAANAWIYAHGLASLIAAGMMEYNEEKIEKMLESFLE